jgi:hypothetical protein
MPLLPPNSRSERPKRSATTLPTSRPILPEPVAEISGTRRSATSRSPTPVRPPITRLKIGGAELAFKTRAAILVTAMAVSGAW